LTGRRYPHVQLRSARPAEDAGTRFIAHDLDAVLRRYNQVLDVSRDDLGALLAGAEMEGYRRRLGDVRCKDVMSGNVISVEYGTSLLEAWNLMKVHRIKSSPVTDRVRRVIGIVTMVDFMRGTTVDSSVGFWDSLRRLVLPDGLTHSEKPEVVGQIMTQHTASAHQERHATDLMPIFTETGHHHIPVVDDEDRVVGIVTQSDFLRFLNQRNYLAL
jgi:CBS domain-containing membrane protein